MRGVRLCKNVLTSMACFAGAWGSGAFGNRGVRVCMVDTGLDYFHPDLAANLWNNPNEIPNNGIDDDNDGVLTAQRHGDEDRALLVPLHELSIECSLQPPFMSLLFCNTPAQ